MTQKCLNCGTSEQDKPLLTVTYREVVYYICPQCLPILIHKPQNLAGKLPDAEKFSAAEHDH